MIFIWQLNKFLFGNLINCWTHLLFLGVFGRFFVAFIFYRDSHAISEYKQFFFFSFSRGPLLSFSCLTHLASFLPKQRSVGLIRTALWMRMFMNDTASHGDTACGLGKTQHQLRLLSLVVVIKHWGNSLKNGLLQCV